MAMKYNNLEELRRKKNILKGEVSDMEGLLTFKNAKESLSAFTDGFTDSYLKEVPTEDGGTKLKLNKDQIIQDVRGEVKKNITSKNAVLGIANTAKRNGLVGDAMKLGTMALVTGVVKKNLYSKGWKKKLIGLAIVYLAPIALKFIRKKLEHYQENRSISSLEKLI